MSTDQTMSSDQPSVTRSDEDGLATVTLAQPGLSSRSRAELTAVLEEVRSDGSVRAVLLTGRGRAFCVGQDLAEHARALEADATTAMDVVGESYNPMVLALDAIEVPVVVAINGACVGAGLGLALAGDLRLAAAGAKLGTAFTAIGLSSDSGLAWRLVHTVGASLAAELLLRPDPFPAERALELGLVHGVVDADDLLGEAMAEARRLADGPTAAYRAVKAVLRAASTGSLAESLALEARLQSELGATADHRQAVEAFLAKRQPVFTGR